MRELVFYDDDNDCLFVHIINSPFDAVNVFAAKVYVEALYGYKFIGYLD